MILEMLGGSEGYIQFMETVDSDLYLDDRYGLTEKEALNKFSELFPNGVSSIQSLPRNERNNAVARLSDAGLTAAQICRITGLGKNIVYTVLK